MEVINLNKLAINGGTPCKTQPFPKWPMYGDNELKNVTHVVKSNNWWRMNGSMVDKFEKQFADLHNAKHCLGVTNGTHAIELVLASLGIGRGDEVIIPSFTFISTATGVMYCNAKVVPVDCDPDTFCIDPNAIEQAITPKTRVIIPVHMAGHSCDMDSIMQIAKRNDLKVIEDAAHAHGAEYKNRKIGTFGDAAIFSFQNGKIMTSGEGGAFITNDSKIYEKAYLIHGVGRPKSDRTYQHVELGSNYRMNEFQGAILNAQIERINQHNELREKNAAKLDAYLNEVEGIYPQKRKEYSTLCTHYMYMFYYDSSYFGGMSRMDFVDALIAEGIPAFIAYPLINKTQFYLNNNFRSHQFEPVNNEINLPNSQKIADEVVWLPHFTLLGDEEDIFEIAQAVKKIQSDDN